jgi:hypothetical protein
MWLKALRSRFATDGDSREGRQRRWYRISAAGLVGLGLLLLAYNMGWLPEPVARGTAFWPAAVIVAGLGLLVAGRPALGFELPRFVCERGSSEEGDLWLDTGAADVQVESLAGGDHLAAGKFPSYAGPRVEPEGRRMKVVLDRRATAPLMPGAWAVALNAHLPWAVHLRTGTGALVLNLCDLPITVLDLYSFAGPVDLTLPASGQGDMNLRLVLGDLMLHVPDGVGLRLQLRTGPLVNLHLDGSCLIRTAPNEWATLDFSAASQRFSLSVDLAAGDLRLA